MRGRKVLMANGMPDISIICPVYNPGAYFSACLESLEAQSIFSQLEVVLVDDGSDDGSQAACDAFAAAHGNVRVLHQKNQGQGAARNRAIEAARGEHLLLVDADDEITPDACERLLAYARGADADIVWGDYVDASLFKRSIAELAERGPVKMWRYLRCALSDGLFYITPCVQLVRTSFYREHGVAFDEGGIFEDQLWLMRLMLADARVLRVDLPFYRYNRGDHPSSTSVVTPKRLMDAIDVVYAMIAECEKAAPAAEKRAVAEAFIANSIAILTRSFIARAPKRLQELARIRMNEKYARYAAQTQLLPEASRTLGLAFIEGPERFEAEFKRFRERARAARD